MRCAKQSIIAEQERSSMASTWTEYLVLERRANTRDWRLFVGKYEALAECWAYYDEDLNDFKLPKTINGEKVFEFSDDHQPQMKYYDMKLKAGQAGPLFVP